MRKNVPTQHYQDLFRQVSARIKFAKDRAKFTMVSDSALPGNIGTVYSYGSCVAQEGSPAGSEVILRVMATSLGIYSGRITPTNPGPTSDVNSNPTQYHNLTYPEAPIGPDYVSICVEAGASGTTAYYPMAFLVLNGKIYREVYDPATGTSTWSLLLNLIDTTRTPNLVPKIAICAVRGSSASNPSFAYSAVYSGQDFSDYCLLGFGLAKRVVLGLPPNVTYTYSWENRQWLGFLPRCTAKIKVAAAMTVDGAYVYANNWNRKKPVCVRFYLGGTGSYTGGLDPSASSLVLPIDLVDDESAFNIAGCQQINGESYLTGVVTRTNGPTYTVFLRGLDSLTVSRNMIICDGAYNGRLMVSNGLVWYDAYTRIGWTDSIGSFGFTPTYSTVDLFGFGHSSAPNQGDRLSLDLPQSIVDNPANNIFPGADAILEVDCNDVAYQLGRFGVDEITRSSDGQGDNASLSLTSHSLKKMVDWQADTYYQYLGQSEVHGEQSDLTKLIRQAGLYDTEDGLKLESLNDDGILYTTPPSSFGCWMSARFTGVPASDAILGVGCNYGEETLQEAATRLSKRIEDTKDVDRMRYGLFAIYVPDAPHKVYLVDYNTVRTGGTVAGTDSAINPWRTIATVDLTNYDVDPDDLIDPASIAFTGQIDLAVAYQNGVATVYASTEATHTDPAKYVKWKCILRKRCILSWDSFPSEHDNYGRGVVLYRNNTGFKLGYPFPSNSDVVPLYDQAGLENECGVPFIDASSKILATNGTVKVDSELIAYEGLANAQAASQELQWVPGKKIVTDVTDWTTAGTEVIFALDRHNNYVEQKITAPGDGYINCVKVWAKKINWPEDGLQCAIYGENSLIEDINLRATPLGKQLSVSQVASDKISANGDIITFFFSPPARITAGSPYRVLLRRAKDPTHPNKYGEGSSYFAVKKWADTVYTGGSLYIFSEQDRPDLSGDDWIYPQNGDMPFEVYAKHQGVGREYAFPLIYDANKLTLPQGYTDTTFNGMAIAITSGAGKGNAYRVVRFEHVVDAMNDLAIFYLDRDPGLIFDGTTKARLVHAFYGLKRGQSETYPAAHGDKMKVHRPPAVSYTYPKGRVFHYASADIDLMLCEVAREIAIKAGVTTVDFVRSDYLSTLTKPLEGVEPRSEMAVASQNVILLGDIYDGGSSTNPMNIGFLDADGHTLAAISYYVTTFSPTIKYMTLSMRSVDKADPTYTLKTVSQFTPHRFTGLGDLRISLADGHISLWACGELIFTDVLPALTGDDRLRYETIKHYSAMPLSGIYLRAFEAGSRVDSFFIDQGKTGMQALSTLIGEKRVYFREDNAGRLRIYENAETIPDTYVRAEKFTEIHTDEGLATRVLLEGGEIVEVHDMDRLNNYGNLFKTVSLSEINSKEDAAYYAQKILEDMRRNIRRMQFSGAVDGRVEPTDKMTILDDRGQSRAIVVDSVSITAAIDDGDAIYDMQVNGREQ